MVSRCASAASRHRNRLDEADKARDPNAGRCRFFFLLFTLGVFPEPLAAQNSETSENKDVFLRADSTLYDEKGQHLILEGNVYLTQAGIEIQTQKARVDLDEQGEAKRIETLAPLEARSDGAVLTGKKGIYLVEESLLTLHGDVSIDRDGLFFVADWVRYDLNQRKLIARNKDNLPVRGLLRRDTSSGDSVSSDATSP